MFKTYRKKHNFAISFMKTKNLKSIIQDMSFLENQQLEWKEAWRDDYLKWICGFANVQGGTLVIGENDKDADTDGNGGVNEIQKTIFDFLRKLRIFIKKED